jgi:hypothetical protein
MSSPVTPQTRYSPPPRFSRYSPSGKGTLIPRFQTRQSLQSTTLCASSKPSRPTRIPTSAIPSKKHHSSSRHHHLSTLPIQKSRASPRVPHLIHHQIHTSLMLSLRPTLPHLHRPISLRRECHPLPLASLQHLLPIPNLLIMTFLLSHNLVLLAKVLLLL